jgi:hypothetical protein
MNEHVPADAPRSYLASLLRLWTLRKVASPPSGRATPIVVCFGALWLSLWLAIDWWDARPAPQFVADGAPLLAWYVLAVLGLAALLRWRSKPAPHYGAVLALVTGLVPVPLLLATIAADHLNSTWLLGLSGIAAGYSLLYLAHGLRAFTGQSQRMAAVAGVVCVAGFLWLSDALDVIPDLWAPRAAQASTTDEDVPDAESLLFEQAGRIDRALQAIGREDSAGAPRAFFLGFAGVGEQSVFAQEIALASQVLARRYRIDGRGLSLFLSVSSHGAPDPAIAVSNLRLPLDDLTDEALAEALADSGIKWRVIIISACYAGAFIAALKNPQTIVIAAAAADRTSFGCSNDRDLTYFGEAFYRDALPGSRSLRSAFDTATAAIAARERSEHVDASLPQAYFGAELEAKLTSMSPAP